MLTSSNAIDITNKDDLKKSWWIFLKTLKLPSFFHFMKKWWGRRFKRIWIISRFHWVLYFDGLKEECGNMMESMFICRGSPLYDIGALLYERGWGVRSYAELSYMTQQFEWSLRSACNASAHLALSKNPSYGNYIPYSHTVQCGYVISLSPLIILIKGSEISNIKGLEREPAINHRGTLGIATS